MEGVWTQHNGIADGCYLGSGPIGAGVFVDDSCHDLAIGELYGTDNAGATLWIDAERAGDDVNTVSRNHISVAQVNSRGGDHAVRAERVGALRIGSIVARDTQRQAVYLETEDVVVDSLLLENCADGVRFVQSSGASLRGGNRLHNLTASNIAGSEIIQQQAGANWVKYADGPLAVGFLADAFPIYDAEELSSSFTYDGAIVLEPGTQVSLVIDATAGDSQGNVDIRVSHDDVTYSTLGTAIAVAKLAGTHDGADNAGTLTDTSQNWSVNELVGREVSNNTDGSSKHNGFALGKRASVRRRTPVRLTPSTFGI